MGFWHAHLESSRTAMFILRCHMVAAAVVAGAWLLVGGRFDLLVCICSLAMLAASTCCRCACGLYVSVLRALAFGGLRCLRVVAVVSDVAGTVAFAVFVACRKYFSRFGRC